MKQKIAIALVALCWGALSLAAWLNPGKDFSLAERRKLTQFPEISGKSLKSGDFMEKFNQYSLDQFPLRDSFRTLKALSHQYVLGFRDNNGIYLADGWAAKQEYPLQENSVNHAIKVFTKLRQQYLKDSKVFFAMVPEKGYYLSEKSGHLSLDYPRLLELLEAGLPWAEMIDLRDSLTVESYYHTDTHWRQEMLEPVAEKLWAALDIAPVSDFRQNRLEQPFYGVYFGQSALPLQPDAITLLETQTIQNATVYDWERQSTGAVYDLEKLSSPDLYDVYLSGARSLLTIHNPAGEAGRELLVFRDSFGSSLLPLLIHGYETITVADLRYLPSQFLGQYIDFHGQDVLMLYSALILNNSVTLS